MVPAPPAPEPPAPAAPAAPEPKEKEKKPLGLRSIFDSLLAWLAFSAFSVDASQDRFRTCGTPASRILCCEGEQGQCEPAELVAFGTPSCAEVCRRAGSWEEDWTLLRKIAVLLGFSGRNSAGKCHATARMPRFLDEWILEVRLTGRASAEQTTPDIPDPPPVHCTEGCSSLRPGRQSQRRSKEILRARSANTGSD